MIYWFISVFAMLGMLSPASRGALATAAIFCYVFMGLIAGYFSARIYKTMKGKEWKRAAFLVYNLKLYVCGSAKTKIIADRHSVPWNRLLLMLFPELLHLGQALERSCSFPHHAGTALPLVLHISAPGLPWLLLRLP